MMQDKLDLPITSECHHPNMQVDRSWPVPCEPRKLQGHTITGHALAEGKRKTTKG